MSIHKKTKFFLFLIFTVLIILIMTFVFFKFEFYKVFKSLFPFLILINQLSARPHEKNVCLEPGCVIAASEIIKSIDESVNPCDDFYEFACNDWMKNEFIPEDKSGITNFGKLREDLRRKLRIILESPIDNHTQDYMIKAQNFYKSCIDLKSIEKKNDQPLRDVLDKVGGWPVLNSNWDESKFDWIDQLIKFRKLGFSHDMIYDLSVSQDFKNNTVYKIQLDQSDLGMPDRSYLIKGSDDPTVKSYYQLAVNSAVLLGADLKKASEELLQAIKFEITLANLSLPKEERRNFTKLYNLYNIEELSKIAPNTNWSKYFNELIGLPITNQDEIIVAVPDFITAVDKILAKENKKTIANFLVWRIVLKSINSLSKPYRNIYLEYQKLINGNSQNPPRWDYCVQKVSSSMNIGLSSMYVKNYFNPESKKKAVTLVDYLQKELLKILNTVDWMDDKTLSLAIEKAKSFKSYIGYPDELLNDTLINENYENLTMSKDNYFENILFHSKYITDKSFNKLREFANKDNWKKHASAATVNAFNYLDDNSIEFPAGILQGNFYNSQRPNYLNFAAIGFVIGHELTHGFDDAGKQFDKNGNNINWWEPDTDLKFKERAQCIIDQYSNFTEETTKLSLNGQATQGENIADNGGMKEALQAYHQWVKDNGEEPSLPGLKKYTNDQLFFISFGNVWCSVQRPEFMKKMILSDEHSPGRFRVNGVVQNSKEFSEAFNCPVGSKMNPTRKCKVW